MKQNKLPKWYSLFFWSSILLFLVFHVLTILPSGTDACFKGVCGVLYWGVHEHDGLWHIALATTTLQSWPFILPNFSGATLSGYNYLLDVVLVFLSRLGVQPLISYFKLLPLVWIGLFTYLALKFADLFIEKRSLLFRWLLLFFFLLSGSFAYIPRLYHAGTIWRSGGMSVMQSTQTLTNLQYAFSLCILLFALIKIKRGDKCFKSFVVYGLLIFIAIGLKVYAGIVLALMVGVYALALLFKEKNSFQFVIRLIPLVSGFFASIMVFYGALGLKGGSSTFVWDPFALVNPIIEQQDLFYIPSLALARYYLQSTGKVGLKLIGILGFSTVLFLVFNFGTRIIACLEILIRGLKKKLTIFDAVTGSAIIFGTLMPVLFVQKGGWWNTIQFMYYSLFLMNIYTAYYLYGLLQGKQVWKKVIVIIILTLTIPSSIDIFRSFVFAPPHAYVSRPEQEALAYLKKLPKGIVLTEVYYVKRRNFVHTEPALMYQVVDNTYIPAYTGHTMYFTNEGQLELLNINFQKRKDNVMNRSCEVLEDINYVYEYRAEFKRAPLTKDFAKKCKVKFKRLFRNEIVSIYSKM